MNKDVYNTLNELLKNTFKDILMIEENVLRDSGVDISITEVHILESVQISKTKTMSDVARLNKVTQGTLTIAVKRLVDKGYIVRHKESNDKRIVLLSLTPIAKQTLEKHDAFHEEMVNKMVKELSLEEDKVLIQSLTDISNFLKSNY